jgi:pimeloyl-ACP methyl ester carboxylesterase
VTPDRTPDGYDAQNLATDQILLLDALSLGAAHVVGFDLGAAPAFALAAAHAERVQSLTIIEAIIGGLAGAETFLAAGGRPYFTTTRLSPAETHTPPPWTQPRFSASTRSALLRLVLKRYTH